MKKHVLHSDDILIKPSPCHLPLKLHAAAFVASHAILPPKDPLHARTHGIMNMHEYSISPAVLGHMILTSVELSLVGVYLVFVRISTGNGRCFSVLREST